MEYKDLISRAILARDRAYAPYSHFKVGASLLCANGKIYDGCNVENASYGATICAERGAFASAIANGERDFVAIAIVGGLNGTSEPCFPCGICRQFMSELCGNEFEVVLCNGDSTHVYKLDELLPYGFNKDSLV